MLLSIRVVYSGRFLMGSYSKEIINSEWLGLLYTLRTQEYGEIIEKRAEYAVLIV